MRRISFFLLIASTLLAVWIFAVEMPRRQQTQDAAVEKERLLDFELSTLRSFAVEREDDPFLMEKIDGRWHLKRPIQEELSDARVATVLGFLGAGRRVRPVGDGTISEGMEAEFGLGIRRVEIVLGSEGGERQELVVGSSQPGGEGFYVLLDGELWLASGSLGRVASFSHHSVRSDELFSASEDQITELKIQWGGESLQAQRHPDGLWYQGEERLRRAPLDAVAYAVATARIQGFVRDGDPGPLAGSFGLDSPLLFLDAEAEGGEAIHLRFGKAGSQGRVFVWRSPRDGILLLLPEIFDLAQLHHAELLDQSLLARSFPRLLEVRAEEGGKVLVARRDGKEWVVEGVGRDLQAPAHLAFRNALTELEEASVDIRLVDTSGSELVGDGPEVQLRWSDGTEELRLAWDGERRELWVQRGDERARLPRQVLLAWRAALALLP